MGVATARPVAGADAEQGGTTGNGRRAVGPRALLFRLHSFAGLIIAPLLVIATLSGLAYALAPTAEKIVYHDQLTASSGAPARPLDEQVEAAAKVHPDLPVTAVQASDDPRETTRVLFNDASLQNKSYRRVVFVDPGDLGVKGDMVQYGSSAALPLRAFISEGHKRLWLGEPGRWYSELAASWMGFLTIGGLWLWWDRKRRDRGRQRDTGRAESPRRRQMRKHSTVGLWILAGMVFLTITGLTWSSVAGANIAEARKALDWVSPKPSTSIGAPAAPAAGEHSGHAHHDHAAAGAQALAEPTAPYAQINRVNDVARGYGLTRRIEIGLPKQPGDAWTAGEARQEWRTHRDLLPVDGASGKIVDEVPFGKWPWPAKITDWLIDAHMGILLGWLNQLVLAAIAVGLLFIIYRGYRMWFLRGRRMVPASRWRDIRPGALLLVLGLLVGYSVIAPLFGISLVALVLLDALLRFGARKR